MREVWQWVEDKYVIQAADAAATYACRGWNVALGRWETLPATNLTPYGGDLKPLMLRHVECRVFHTSGTEATGVLLWLGCAIDQKRPGVLLTLGNFIHGVANRAVVWQGNIPLGGGVVWRVAQGGLIAGDWVEMAVGYE